MIIKGEVNTAYTSTNCQQLVENGQQVGGIGFAGDHQATGFLVKPAFAIDFDTSRFFPRVVSLFSRNTCFCKATLGNPGNEITDVVQMSFRKAYLEPVY